MTSKINIKPKTLFKKTSNPKSANTQNDKDVTTKGIDDKYNGVYQIFCKETKKSYIGSSSNIEKRLQTHKQHLEKGCHNSRILQKEYDKYGLDNFEFIILEKDIEDTLLTAYEKYWIYKTDAIVKYKGYNEKMPTLNHENFKKIYTLKEGEEQ